MNNPDQLLHWKRLIVEDYCKEPPNRVRVPGVHTCYRPFTIFHSGGELIVAGDDSIEFTEYGDIVIRETGKAKSLQDEEERKMKERGKEVGFWASVFSAGVRGLTAPKHQISLASISRISELR
jgi:hypothetical protein